MDILGRVHNGVVVLNDGVLLPEGAMVVVSIPDAPAAARSVTWDEIFAAGLTIGSAPPDRSTDGVEVTGDDFIF